MPKPAPKSSKAAAKTGKSAAAKAGPKAKTLARPAKSDSKKADAKHPEVKAEKKVPKVAEPKKADAKKTDAKTAKGAEAKKGAKAPLVEVKKTSAKSEKPKAGEKHDAKVHEAKHEAKAHEAKGHDAKHDAKAHDAKHEAKGHDAKNDKGAKAAAAAKAEDDAKSARKGITIVTPKPVKKMPPKPAPIGPVPMSLGRLMDPTNPPRRPLIPSGPKAAATRPLGAQGSDGATLQPVKGKTPFNKRELDRYRDLLINKRAQLVGDVTTMETQALQGDSGSLSSTPQHMAEQGSETYDQSLSLDLAEKDRKLIREIDDALTRIEQGTFGICEISGKPIKHERLEELPWARCTIEAQRELERLRMRI